MPTEVPNPSIQANPLYNSRNAIWAYTTIQAGPVRGPQPRLAQGSGHTGGTALPGNAPQLPGYLADNEYFPNVFEYQNKRQEEFIKRIPRTIGTGNDGVELVGTYRAHDWTPADRQLQITRSSEAWQVMEYPPDVRNLLAWQQVMRYRVNSLTLSPRVLDQSQYFLGYQVSSSVAGDIGQTGLGSMGSQ